MHEFVHSESTHLFSKHLKEKKKKLFLFGKGTSRLKSVNDIWVYKGLM